MRLLFLLILTACFLPSVLAEAPSESAPTPDDQTSEAKEAEFPSNETGSSDGNATGEEPAAAPSSDSNTCADLLQDIDPWTFIGNAEACVKDVVDNAPACVSVFGDSNGETYFSTRSSRVKFPVVFLTGFGWVGLYVTLEPNVGGARLC